MIEHSNGIHIAMREAVKGVVLSTNGTAFGTTRLVIAAALLLPLSAGRGAFTRRRRPWGR